MRILKGTLLSLLFIPTLVSAGEWIYTVRPGDNLWNITERYMLSMRYWVPLLKLNQIDQPKRMLPGTLLRMPQQWSKISRVGAVIVDLTGTVEIVNLRSGKRRPAKRGERLMSHHRVITHQDSRMLLEFGDKSRLLLSSGSRLDLEKLQGYGDGDVTDTQIRLQQGGSESLVNPDKKSGTRFEIFTPSALTAVRGTGYRLNTSDEGRVTRVEVTSGQVAVAGGGKTISVSGGYGLLAEQGRPPQQPIQLLPPPSLAGVPKLVEDLDWEFQFPRLAKADGYRVQVVEERNLSAPKIDQMFSGVQINLNLHDLPDGKYLMKVRGLDTEAIEGRNALHSFELNARPQPPFQVSPAAGAEFIETRPTFEWARPEGAGSYRLQLARNHRMDDPILDEVVPAKTRYVPAEDLPTGLYFWRVAAFDAKGDLGPMGFAQQFRILPLPPDNEPPLLDDSGLTFHWRPGTQGQRFGIQLATDAEFTQLLADTETEEPSFHLANPTPGTYFMRVKTIDVDGAAGPFGETQSIEVEGPADHGWVVLIPAAFMLLLAL